MCAHIITALCRSGTDEQYTEKEALLEVLKPRYEEREDYKGKTAAMKERIALLLLQ